MKNVALPALLGLAFWAPATKADVTHAQAREFITETTRSIPHQLPDNPTYKTDGAMPPAVLAYSRFFWLAERIGGNCGDVEHRSAIGMLDPDSGLLGWELDAHKAGHPNQNDFLEVIRKVDEFYEGLGEVEFCSIAYRMLGPNGEIVETTTRINNFMSLEDQENWAIWPEDGAVWSSRDYCERGYYLTPPADQNMHDYVCREAEEQGF